MAIILPKKKSPSNKAQTLAEHASTTTIPSPPIASSSISDPSPFIDKLTLALDVPSDEEGHDIYSALFSVLDDKSQFVDAGPKAKWAPYNLAKRIVLPNLKQEKHRPLLQVTYVPTSKVVTKVRLDFVPVDLGPDGMEQLHAALIVCFDNGWGFFVKHAKITRIDIAVDFPNVPVSEFLLLPHQGATVKQWGVSGKLQTFQHGKKGGNLTQIYDRGEKRKALGQDPTGKSGARVERRIKNPANGALKLLKGFPNPFAAMNIVALPDAPPPGEQAYVWELFRHAVEAVGLPTSLAVLPEKKRTIYRAHLKAHGKLWWDPQTIWSKWPDMVDELKIAGQHALK